MISVLSARSTIHPGFCFCLGFGMASYRRAAFCIRVRNRFGDAVYLPANRLLNLLFHFCRRCVRKRHDQHVVNRAAFLQNQTLDTFHQNCRLTGACCCRHQQILSAPRDCLRLLRRPAHSGRLRGCRGLLCCSCFFLRTCLRLALFCGIFRYITAGCNSHIVLIIPAICSFAHAHVSSHTQPAHPVVMHCACLYSLSSHICVTDALSAPMPRHAALRSMRVTLNCFYYSRFCSAFQDRNRVFSDYVGDIA